MSLTDSVVEVTQYMYNLISSAKADLGLSDVFWGDQTRLPRYPVACVVAGNKTRELNGLPRKTDVQIECYVVLYHGEVQSPQTNDQEASTLAEAVESLLHQDAQMGGKAIHSMVSEVDPGWANRANTLVRATRLTFQVQSQTMLPFNVGGI